MLQASKTLHHLVLIPMLCLKSNIQMIESQAFLHQKENSLAVTPLNKEFKAGFLFLALFMYHTRIGKNNSLVEVNLENINELLLLMK